MMGKGTSAEVTGVSQWTRIPDGVRVGHRNEGHEGSIDGLTALCIGKSLNPDGKTQYRVDVGSPERQLLSEGDLNIVIDGDGLVVMTKQPIEYRRHVTDRLRAVFAADRFVPSIKQTPISAPAEKRKREKRSAPLRPSDTLT